MLCSRWSPSVQRYFQTYQIRFYPDSIYCSSETNKWLWVQSFSWLCSFLKKRGALPPCSSGRASSAALAPVQPPSQITSAFTKSPIQPSDSFSAENRSSLFSGYHTGYAQSGPEPQLCTSQESNKLHQYRSYHCHKYFSQPVLNSEQLESFQATLQKIIVYIAIKRTSW